MTSELLGRAGFAYLHEISFMVCFAALVLERKLLRPNPDRASATQLIITDVVYGIAALTLLGSGVLRVLHFGQGAGFYMANPLFWWKVGIYLGAGSLSLYPTITYILWAIPLRKGEAPSFSAAAAQRIGWVINIELLAFACLPFMASLMARGVGLPALPA
jgi:putative membrane protein